MAECFQLFFSSCIFCLTLAGFCLQATANASDACVVDEPFVAAQGLHRENGDPRPNIVLIYADDVDCETVFGTFPDQNSDTVQFPNLKALAKSGIRFSNFHVTTPVCGPSRACLYSGQYAHRNRCRVNDSGSIRSLGFTGGFRTFDPKNELSIWMKQAGYETAHVGKFLHEGFKPNYEAGIKWQDIVPPGWDHFEVSLGSRYFGYPAYSKSQNVILKSSGKGCRTDNEIDKAIEIIDSHDQANDPRKPLFLSWSPIAAHIPGDRSEMVAERHKAVFADAQLPEMQDRLGVKTRNQVEETKNLVMPDARKIQLRIDAWRNRMSAMLTLDENIGRLREGLRRRGLLDNTIFIFTSDHGFRYFQHRHFGKRLPYDRITRVPFIVSGPRIPQDVDCNQLLANIDIAPTLVDIASGSVPKSCDGISFAKLMRNPAQQTGRESIIVENWGEVVSQGAFVPATYCSMRTQSAVYTEWATGGLEYYDLKEDPYQNNNLYPDLGRPTQSNLSAQLKRIRTSNDPPTLSKVILKRKQLCASIKPVTLSGYAESSAGLESVHVEIQCRRTKEYWNGDAWSKELASVPTRLDQKGGVISRWVCKVDSQKYAIDRSNDLTERDVTLNVFALDRSHQKAELKDAARFRLAFLDPETGITTISCDDQLTIAGSAFDFNGVKRVRVSIKQTNSGKFWNGSQWQQNLHQFDADLDAKSPESGIKNSCWNFNTELNCKSKRLTIIARAYGPNGVFDHSPAIKSVFIK